MIEPVNVPQDCHEPQILQGAIVEVFRGSEAYISGQVEQQGRRQRTTCTVDRESGLQGLSVAFLHCLEGPYGLVKQRNNG